MKVFIVSGELSKAKTTKMITIQLESLIPKKNQIFFDPLSKKLSHRLQEEQPHFVILHKINRKTKKIEEKIKRKSPETHILYALDNQWESVLEILSNRLIIA